MLSRIVRPADTGGTGAAPDVLTDVPLLTPSVAACTFPGAPEPLTLDPTTRG